MFFTGMRIFNVIKTFLLLVLVLEFPCIACMFYWH